jgi:7-carboxy-7-deazaguanine synthase
MITPLIVSDPNLRIADKPTREDSLIVSEFFGNTIQGENWSGVPSTFLRLTGCTLDCVWCDTLEVWRYGKEYSFTELLKLMQDSGITEQLRKGQHLILTGGSPLKQQDRLVRFITRFSQFYSFKPYIEVENEAVKLPSKEFEALVDCWNNSPKLANSGMKERARYKPEIISHMSRLNNSWFKFVVSSEQDWEEIKRDYLPHIKREQLVLMPEGQTREQLQAHYDIVVNIAVRENVRMCDRLHVTIFNQKTGV